jgi:cellobiose-specific phosphotransferase system component IIC
MLNEGVSNPDGGFPNGFQHEPMRPVQDASAQEIPRPKAVDNAFRASLASTAIASVSTVVTVLFDQAWLDQFARQMLKDSGRPVTDADLATGMAVARVSLGLGVLLFAALFVLFALKMRQGRGWARILLTMFAVLGAVNFLSAVASTGAALSLMWSLADVAFSITAVVYMFRPESAAYFLEHRKRRLARRGGRPHA